MANNKVGSTVKPGPPGMGGQFTMRLTHKQLQAIEQLVARNPGWSKAEALRHLIDRGIRALGLE